jgi:hypothetical protein
VFFGVAMIIISICNQHVVIMVVHVFADVDVIVIFWPPSSSNLLLWNCYRIRPPHLLGLLAQLEGGVFLEFLFNPLPG